MTHPLYLGWQCDKRVPLQRSILDAADCLHGKLRIAATVVLVHPDTLAGQAVDIEGIEVKPVTWIRRGMVGVQIDAAPMLDAPVVEIEQGRLL